MLKIKCEVVPEHTKKRTEYFCDICGKDLQNDRSWGLNGKMSYTGENDSGEIDICMKCMKNTILPLVCSIYKIEPR